MINTLGASIRGEGYAIAHLEFSFKFGRLKKNLNFVLVKKTARFRILK